MKDTPTKKEMVEHILLTSPQAIDDLMSGKLESIKVPYMVPKEDFNPSAFGFEWDPCFRRYVPISHVDIMMITLTKEDFGQ